MHQLTKCPQKSKDRLATDRLAKIRWERNEEVEGIATVAGVPEIQVSLLQKCACEGAAFRPVVSAHVAGDSHVVLPSLLRGSNSSLRLAAAATGSILGLI